MDPQAGQFRSGQPKFAPSAATYSNRTMSLKAGYGTTFLDLDFGLQGRAARRRRRAVFPAGHILVNNFRLANCILRAHSVSLS